MEVVSGGGAMCDATVNFLFWGGASIVAIPLVGIIGGVSMVIGAAAWALGGCGYK